MSHPLQWFGAALLGLVLFALPFVRYATGGHVHATGPHSDHDARHGGLLFMVREYHLEIVERVHTVELYLSDPIRRPLRPDSCTVQFDAAPKQNCEWKSHRSVVDRPPDSRAAIFHLSVQGGPTLSMRFP